MRNSVIYGSFNFLRSVDSSGGQSLQITVNVWDQIAQITASNTETGLPVPLVLKSDS